jgi:hypothetical protein
VTSRFRDTFSGDTGLLRRGRYAFFVGEATEAEAVFFFLPASGFVFFFSLVALVTVFAMAILPWFGLRTISL